MPVNPEDLDRISFLARIQLAPEDRAEFTDALTRILDLVDQMNSVGTDNVEPMLNPHDEKAVMRADAVTESDQREQFLPIAPATENGLYLVPQVID